MCMQLLPATVAAVTLCPQAATVAPSPAAQMLPLQPQVAEMAVAGRPSGLEGIERRINRNLEIQRGGGAEVFDPTDIPIVGGLLDEEGNVNLPLGITVFDTMGDPSVGFGGSF